MATYLACGSGRGALHLVGKNKGFQIRGRLLIWQAIFLALLGTTSNQNAAVPNPPWTPGTGIPPRFRGRGAKKQSTFAPPKFLWINP